MSLDKDGLLDVEWAEVPPHLAFDISLWLGGSDDPLEIRQNGEPIARLVDHRIGGALLLGVGLFEWIQLGVAVPYILSQSGDEQVEGVMGTLPSLSSVGIGDIRIIPKIRLLRQQDQGISIALMPGVVLPTSGGDDYFGSNRVSFEPELLIGRRFGPFRLGGNVGYRFRNSADFLNLEVGDEVFGRIGAGYWFGDDDGPPLEVDLTVAGAFSGSTPFDEDNQNYAELLGGISYDFAGPFLAFAGGGIGLNEGFGTPDWRVFAGIRYSKRTFDSDGDGIDDSSDQCPKAPEDKDGFEDRNGCPDPDNDNDGVLDKDDKAPMDPEDKDNFEDEDGVPDPDNDQDGVPDQKDACPNKAGNKAFAGCPDADQDGIMDAEDACPNQPEDKDNFQDNDGCPDPDNDKDGVMDTADKCPNDPGVVANNGCKDTDRDKDGVVDRLDNCPDEPGVKAQQGCKKKQLVVITKEKLEILDKVYFQTGSAKIQRRSYALLDNVAAVISAHPEIEKIRVEGHTDDRGRDDLNLKLSQRRADAVKAYLMKKGLEEDRLEAVGYGESKPVADNKTRAGRAQNRRVDFVIVGENTTIQEGDSRQLEVDE